MENVVKQTFNVMKLMVCFKFNQVLSAADFTIKWSLCAWRNLHKFVYPKVVTIPKFEF